VGGTPGGRTILDAVEKSLELPLGALISSRSVLAQYGNMSSATVMFVLEQIIARAQRGNRAAQCHSGRTDC